jgi:hypothetical protein
MNLKLGSRVSLNSAHLAAVLTLLVTAVGQQLLQPGSLDLTKLGPWGGLVAVVIALVARSIIVPPNTPPVVPPPAPTPPAETKAPAALRMIYALAALILLAFALPRTQPSHAHAHETVAAAVAGCNKVAPVTADVGQVTICVEEAIAAAVAAGTTTFEDIATAVGTSCGMITAQEIANIIDLWTNGPAGDAGTLVIKSTKVAALLEDPDFRVKLRSIRHKE